MYIAGVQQRRYGGTTLKGDAGAIVDKNSCAMRSLSCCWLAVRMQGALTSHNTRVVSQNGQLYAQTQDTRTVVTKKQFRWRVLR